VGVAVEVAPAAGANVCRTGSHRGRCSYRQACPPRVVGAPSGCECVMGRLAPGRCSYKGTWPDLCCRSTLRVRMRARPVRTGGGAPTDEPVTTPYCRSTLRVRMRARPVRTEAVLLQTNPAAGVYSARVQVEVRPNMGVPTKPRSLSTLSPSRVMRPW